jgi:hypothetical protein
MVPAPRSGRRRVRMFRRLVWRVLDWIDYRIWDARVRMVDAVYGPEPETEADRERRERRC